MTRPDLHLHLDAYLSVREALGFQMRAARTLLRDFVHYVVFVVQYRLGVGLTDIFA
jgi:hypothetical protein